MNNRPTAWLLLLTAVVLSGQMHACGNNQDLVPITLEFTLTELDGQTSLVGAQICSEQGQLKKCELTDAAGYTRLEGVPGNSRIKLRFTKDGFVTTVWPLVTTEEDRHFAAVMVDQQTIDLQFAALGLTEDTGAGHLGFALGNADGVKYNEPAGVSASLTPAEGIGFYANEGGLPSVSLAATTTAGSGGVANIPPGDYNLTLTGLPSNCSTRLGWSENPASHMLTIEASVTTWIEIYCP